MTLSPLLRPRFVELEQLAGVDVEYLAKRGEQSRVKTLEPTLCADQAIYGLLRGFAENCSGLGDLIGRQFPLLHPILDANEHGRNNTAIVSLALVTFPLVLFGVEANDEVAAIDEANQARLCVRCRASYPVGIAGFCASCLYDFYPDDDIPTTTSEAHAA